MNTKDEFVRKMHSELDQFNNEIDTLVNKADKAEERLQAEFRQQIKELHSKRDEIYKQLYELEQAREMP